MIIYHGSTVLVEKPEIRISGSFLDFGTGFYTTTSEHQAERWDKNQNAQREQEYRICFDLRI
mgnify:CR=1 FL=1